MLAHVHARVPAQACFAVACNLQGAHAGMLAHVHARVPAQARFATACNLQIQKRARKLKPMPQPTHVA